MWLEQIASASHEEAKLSTVTVTNRLMTWYLQVSQSIEAQYNLLCKEQIYLLNYPERTPEILIDQPTHC